MKKLCQELQQLKEHEASLQTILNAAPVGIGMVKDRTLQWCGPSLLSMLEYTEKKDLEGKSARVLYLNEEEFLRVAEVKHPMILEKGVGTIETQFVSKSGKILDILLSSSAIFPGDLDRGIIFTAQDISDKKKVDKQILEANNDLKQFAFAVSHDLREPLRTMHNYLDLIQLTYRHQIDPRDQHWFDFIFKNSLHMQELIQGLTDYLRSGQVDLKKENIDLNLLVEDVRLMLKVPMEESEAILTTVSPGLPIVYACPNMMRQVLQNLVHNALKFRKPHTRPVIEIACHAEGHRFWMISVKDNGIGIPLEYQQQVFLPFKRVHSKNQYPGSGLGLALAKKILERHDGRMWVMSVPDQGSIFYFVLPK